jgi:hypothetical protein
MTVAGAVRHHYLPTFLQRRFGCDPGDARTQIVRLDLKTGTSRRSSPTNEAVRRHYYRLEDEDGNVEDGVEGLLSMIESRAAKIIRRIVAAPTCTPEPEEIVGLAMFVATMAHRTPDARADLAFADVELSKLVAERLFSDTEAARRALGEDLTDEEVSARQQALLDDLRNGRIAFESTPAREVGFMLAAMAPITEWLISKAAWTVLVTPPERSFVLSDAPVVQYDMTPKAAEAGAGFDSSPGAMTVFAVDPSVALLIQPSVDDLLDWRTRAIDAVTVDDINLLIYAQADQAIYGPSQAILTGLRADAKRSPKWIGEYRRRRARIWITEVGPEDQPGEGGVRRFRSVNRDGVATQEFYIPRATEQEARRRAF